MPRATTYFSVAGAIGLIFALYAAARVQAGDAAAERSSEQVSVLQVAHAHNDYLHGRPLLDALDHGFCSVEADIFLVDGELLVAHTRDEIQADRTLRSLYLEPLRQRIRANGGRVYAASEATLTLLIDIKSNGEQTWPVLHRLLAEYEDILTLVGPNEVRPGPVHAIISGSRPIALMAQERVRYAGVDGRMSDLDSDYPARFMPLVSDHWFRHFQWHGAGPMPTDQRKKLREVVAQAHAKGYRVRFWATPENESVWRALLECHVDLISTDSLSRLRDFLLAEQSQTQP